MAEFVVEIDLKNKRRVGKCQLIRCKDCRHWTRISTTKDGNCHDHMIERRTKEYDFCSHGEVIGGGHE